MAPISKADAQTESQVLYQCCYADGVLILLPCTLMTSGAACLLSGDVRGDAVKEAKDSFGILMNLAID